MSSRVSKQPQVSKIKYFIEIGSDIEIQSDQARRVLGTHTGFIMAWFAGTIQYELQEMKPRMNGTPMNFSFEVSSLAVQTVIVSLVNFIRLIGATWSSIFRYHFLVKKLFIEVCDLSVFFFEFVSLPVTIRGDFG